MQIRRKGYWWRIIEIKILSRKVINADSQEAVMK